MYPRRMCSPRRTVMPGAAYMHQNARLLQHAWYGACASPGVLGLNVAIHAGEEYGPLVAE